MQIDFTDHMKGGYWEERDYHSSGIIEPGFSISWGSQTVGGADVRSEGGQKKDNPRQEWSNFEEEGFPSISDDHKGNWV